VGVGAESRPTEFQLGALRLQAVVITGYEFCLAALMVADGGGGPVCVLWAQALFR